MAGKGKPIRKQETPTTPHLLNTLSDIPLALSQDSTITMNGIVLAKQAIIEMKQEQQRKKKG